MSEAIESYSQGWYQESYQKLQISLEINPNYLQAKKLVDKLENIVKILPQETGEEKIPWLVRRGITAFLEGNSDLALDALIYASQLEPGRRDLSALAKLVRKEHPKVIVLEEGKNLVETKLSQMLKLLLKREYETAAKRGEEILLLEPDNVVVLTRLGSAYWSLGRKEEAREAWQKALKINPENQELINFLEKMGEK